MLSKRLSQARVDLQKADQYFNEISQYSGIKNHAEWLKLEQLAQEECGEALDVYRVSSQERELRNFPSPPSTHLLSAPTWNRILKMSGRNSRKTGDTDVAAWLTQGFDIQIAQ
jgi:hypothetical protein